MLACSELMMLGTLGLACSDVRVVDDDDGAGNAGGAATGAGGTSGNEPPSARLFSAGWLGTEQDRGILIWNNPDEQGIARAADVTIPMAGVELVVGVGDDLIVFDPPQVLVYENAWELSADAQPARATEVYGYSDPVLGHRMRVIPELDLLSIDSLVVKGLSTLSAETVPLVAPWFDPVYDAARDRLLVRADGAIAVLDGASTRSSYETDWHLYASETALLGLASDGATLFTAHNTTSDWHVIAWPMAVDSPSDFSSEHASLQQVVDLVGIPDGGVIAGAMGELRSWPTAGGNASGTYGSENSTWRSVVVSRNGHVYAAGELAIAAFSSVALSDPVLTEGGRSLALIER